MAVATSGAVLFKKGSAEQVCLRQGADHKTVKLLLSNVLWMLLGNVAMGFSQWTLLIVLAKLGTVEMVGNFALSLAVVLPVFMFSSLSLRSLQITDVSRSFRFLEYGATRLVTVFVSIAFIALFSWLSGYSTDLIALTVLLAGAKAFEYLSDILYGLLQQKEDMAGIGISMVLRALLSMTALSVTVHLTHSLVWSAVSLLVSSGLVLLAYDIPKAIADRKTTVVSELKNAAHYVSAMRRTENRQRLNKLALSGLPMGFALLLVSLNLNIPRYFIQQHLGIAELGIFSAISTLLASGSVVINAMGQAAAPRLSTAFSDRNKKKFFVILSGLVAASFGLGGAGLTIAIFFGRQAMALIYRPEYSTRQDVLVWLMAASGLYYLGSTFGYAVTAVRCFSPQMTLFAIAALTTALASLALVPRMGLEGAAVAILVSSAVQCVGSFLLLYKAFHKIQPSVPAVDLVRACSN